MSDLSGLVRRGAGYITSGQLIPDAARVARMGFIVSHGLVCPCERCVSYRSKFTPAELDAVRAGIEQLVKGR